MSEIKALFLSNYLVQLPIFAAWILILLAIYRGRTDRVQRATTRSTRV